MGRIKTNTGKDYCYPIELCNEVLNKVDEGILWLQKQAWKPAFILVPPETYRVMYMISKNYGGGVYFSEEGAKFRDIPIVCCPTIDVPLLLSSFLNE